MKLLIMILGVAIALAPSHPVQADSERKALVDTTATTIEIFKQTQKEKERWALAKTQLIKQKNTLTNDIEDMISTKAELEMMIEKTRGSIDTLEKRSGKMLEHFPVGDIENYLHALLNRLETHIENSLPFLKDERAMRLEALRSLLDNSKIRTAEKLRRMFEALLIEMEYARTVEVYQEAIPIEGVMLTANILRIGSAALFYQSPDKKKVGNYSVVEMGWKPLPGNYAAEIGKAMEIARHKRAADIINLPVGRKVQ